MSRPPRTRPPLPARASRRLASLAARGATLATLATLAALAPAPTAAQNGRPAASLPIDGAAPARPAAGQEPWRIVPLPQSTLVYARDGSLIGEFGKQMRTSVAIRTLPKYVGNAFVAVEDKRFYQHNGVDVIGIAGALKDAVTGDVRGASTITQLLVGNMHPDVIDRRDRSVERKVREQQAALEMERHYSKEQILEAFLNTLDFGHGWFGIDAAARHYFGKPAKDLSLAEAASLASMPKSPVGYDPVRQPARNRERRNTVLELMAQQGYASRAAVDAAKREPLRTVDDEGFAAQAPWVANVVRIQAERAGVPVTRGGYRIHTTIDPVLQRAALEALREQTALIEQRPGYRHQTYAQWHAAGAGRTAPDYLQGAVVAVDPGTGEVRALVGGRDYADSPFDRAVDGMRQPGSSFKPIIYAAAVAAGMPPNTIVADTAIAIAIPGSRTYRPENADGAFLGLLPLREAMARSRNPVAVQLAMQLGMDSVAAMARHFGIRTPIHPSPASALGATALQPLDFVTSYATFANLGVSVQPRFVNRVDDAAGKPVWSAPRAPAELALDPRVAFIVRDMMRDVVERGTATSIRRFLPARIAVAGKTGTTNDNADVWFVGMTPELVAGVWLGFDKPKTITSGAAGGTLAAPVFGQMLQRWYGGRPSATWSPPAGLVTAQLDRLSGQPADDRTPPERRYTEWFIEGTEPGAKPLDPWTIFRWGAVGF